MATLEEVIALYEKCREYRSMHRDIYGPEQYVDQLDFWTRSEIEQFGRQLRLNESSSLLDLGCGLGGPACVWSRVFKARVVGVDISEWHISEAQLTAAQSSCGHNLSFLLSDTRTFDGEGQAFDAAIAIDSVIYMSPLDALIGNVRRMLKPSGKFLLASECFPPETPSEVVQAREQAGVVRCFTEAELTETLRKGGFEIESVERDFKRRERFAKAALSWMENRNYERGRQNMIEILNACQKGGAFEILIVATRRLETAALV